MSLNNETELMYSSKKDNVLLARNEIVIYPLAPKGNAIRYQLAWREKPKSHNNNQQTEIVCLQSPRTGTRYRGFVRNLGLLHSKYDEKGPFCGVVHRNE